MAARCHGLALADRGWMMYAFIFPFALGGLAGPATQAIISREVSPSEQGELQGSINSLAGIAAVVGPLIAWLSARCARDRPSPYSWHRVLRGGLVQRARSGAGPSPFRTSSPAIERVSSPRDDRAAALGRGSTYLAAPVSGLDVRASVGRLRPSLLR